MTAPAPVLAAARDLATAKAEYRAAHDRRNEIEQALPKGDPARFRYIVMSVGEHQDIGVRRGINSVAKSQGLDPEPFVAEWDKLTSQRMAARKTVGIDDEAVDAACERYRQAQYKIAQTPATTLDELAVKVREVCSFAQGGLVDSSEDPITVLCVGVRADLERLIPAVGEAS